VILNGRSGILRKVQSEERDEGHGERHDEEQEAGDEGQMRDLRHRDV